MDESSSSVPSQLRLATNISLLTKDYQSHCHMPIKSQDQRHYKHIRCLPVGEEKNPIYVNFKKDTLKFRLVDQFALLCGLRYGASGLTEAHSDSDVVALLKKVHHIEFGEDYLKYGYLRDMASLERIKIAPSCQLSRLVFWQDESGSDQCERWSNKNESRTKLHLVKSWIGIKMGKWTGPKDRLPSVTYLWKGRKPRGRKHCRLCR